MKNKFSILLLATCVAVLFAASCNKDENANNPPTNTEKISRDWIQLDLVLDVPPIIVATSIFDFIVTKEHQDDILHFKADGNLIVTEGATRKNPNDPDTVTTGTWHFLDGETKLWFGLATKDTQTLFIDTLTTTSLRGHIDTVYAGNNGKVTSILQAQ